MKQKVYRHGEIALIKIAKLPKGLISVDTKVLMQGSHGNNHCFDNGVFYPSKNGNYVFGYLAANNTTLQHPEHGKGASKIKLASIPNGIYELRKQQEHTPEGLKPIID